MIKLKTTIFNYLFLIIVLILQYFSISVGNASNSSSDSFESFIQKVFLNHESLELAKLNVDRTKSEIQIIESTLGLNLFANIGIDQNVSFIGSKTTRSSLLVGINKVFQSGDSIELIGDYSHDDSDFVIINQANPLTTTGVDLGYRIPLMKNENRAGYRVNIDRANSNYTASINSQLIIRDELTTQAIDLYYGVAILVARLKTAKESINRSIKLKNYIIKNIQLGILEKGEVLQAEAQIYNLQGQYEELALIWEQSKISINRLIGVPWDSEFNTSILETPIQNYNLVEVNEIVKLYSPELKTIKLELKLSDSIIALNQNNTKSKLDVIFSIGSIKSEGPITNGDINNSDVVGGIKLEYQKSLDSRGFDNKLYQSQVDKNSIQTQIKKLKYDLEYGTYSLVSQIKQITRVNNKYKKRHEFEKKKFKDIVNRYRTGRADTNLVIQFENELTQADLKYKTQNILREKNITLLNLKQGKLIKIDMPVNWIGKQ